MRTSNPFTATKPWRVPLDGELQERALATAKVLGAAVAHRLASSGSSPAVGDPTLARGWAGDAIVLSYLHKVFPEEGYGAASDTALEQAADAVAKQPLNVGLMQGFTGIAWTVEHLTAAQSNSDPNEAVDEALMTALEKGWEGHFDLVSGLVGLGAYALERLTRPGGTLLLETIVERLAEMSEPTSSGLTWFTPPALIPSSARRRVPEGYYNLGMAHGVPGVVAVLAQVHAAGVSVTRSAELLEGAVRWLLAQALDDEDAPTWPYFVGPHIEPKQARLAWCYGDPGVITALSMAADALGRPDLMEIATRSLLSALERTPDESHIRGAGLCHGAAGLAHIWSRLWQRNDDEGLRAAVAYWTNVALEQRTADAGLAGYSVWDPDDEEGTSGDVQGPGLLAGIGGVALALTAAASEQEPAWDRHLLLSGRAS